MSINLSDLISILGGFAGVISTVVLIIVTWKKSKSDTKISEGDVTLKFAQAAGTAADRASQEADRARIALERMVTLEQQVYKLMDDLLQQKQIHNALEGEFLKLKDEHENLLKQFEILKSENEKLIEQTKLLQKALSDCKQALVEATGYEGEETK